MTTKTDYSKMTNKELDRLAAEMLETGKHPEQAHLFSINGNWFSFNKHTKQTVWNPTHPDSNQARQYLIPKMIEADYLYIMASELLEGTDIEANGKYCIAGIVLEKTNRDIVVACLKTQDILDRPLDPDAFGGFFK